MAQVVVGQVTFPSKKAAIAACSAILNKVPALPSPLSPEDQAFLLDVLELHPGRDEKVKGGVKELWVDRNTYGGRGFFLRRLDGSTTDWSFMNCFNPPSHTSKVKKAFRSVVVPQVLDFVSLTFASSHTVSCAITTRPLRREDAHVDHKYPKTFSYLVETFLKVEDTSFEAIKLKPDVDLDEKHEFADAHLAARWGAFHNQHAELQVVCARENMAKGNRR